MKNIVPYPYSLIGEVQIYITMAAVLALIFNLIFIKQQQHKLPTRYLIYVVCFILVSISFSTSAYKSALAAGKTTVPPVFKTMDLAAIFKFYAIYIVVPMAIYSMPLYTLFKFLSEGVSETRGFVLFNTIVLCLLLIAAALDLLLWRTSYEMIGVAGHPQIIYTEHAIYWHLKYHYIAMALPFVVASLASKLIKHRSVDDSAKPLDLPHPENPYSYK